MDVNESYTDPQPTCSMPRKTLPGRTYILGNQRDCYLSSSRQLQCCFHFSPSVVPPLNYSALLNPKIDTLPEVSLVYRVHLQDLCGLFFYVGLPLRPARGPFVERPGNFRIRKQVLKSKHFEW